MNSKLLFCSTFKAILILFIYKAPHKNSLFANIAHVSMIDLLSIFRVIYEVIKTCKHYILITVFFINYTFTY